MSDLGRRAFFGAALGGVAVALGLKAVAPTLATWCDSGPVPPFPFDHLRPQLKKGDIITLSNEFVINPPNANSGKAWRDAYDAQTNRYRAILR